MLDLHSLPSGSRPATAIRNNGPDHLVSERLKLRELAEGWPLYRSVAFLIPGCKSIERAQGF
jgi:hypothetical protein